MSNKIKRCMIIVKSDISDAAKKRAWNKLIKSMKAALAEYNEKAEYKLCAELKGDFIPMIDQNGKIIGGLY